MENDLIATDATVQKNPWVKNILGGEGGCVFPPVPEVRVEKNPWFLYDFQDRHAVLTWNANATHSSHPLHTKPYAKLNNKNTYITRSCKKK